MQEKLENLAQHAQVLQDTVLKAEHINATLINSIGPGEKQELIRRLKTADHVSVRPLVQNLQQDRPQLCKMSCQTAVKWIIRNADPSHILPRPATDRHTRVCAALVDLSSLCLAVPYILRACILLEHHLQAAS